MTLKTLKTLATGATLLAIGTNLVGCSGSSSSTWGAYSSPYATATGFVNGLNEADNAPIYDDSYVFYDEGQTYRGDNWVVIWDSEYQTYKAVNMDYIRSIVYYDYYSNTTGLAEEYRDREGFDYMNYGNGDLFAEEWEEVNPIYSGCLLFCDESDIVGFRGDATGFKYEDETQTKDGSLLTKESEIQAFAEKAAKVSFAFNVDVKSAVKLVEIGSKAKKMLKDQELTLEDQQELLGDLESLAGKKLSDVMAVANDPAAKKEMLAEVADKIGTSAANLENKILPELFGLQPHE